MFKCIYTGEAFEDSPGEHILQNSFGARWASKKIVSANAQQIFGGGIDVAVDRAFQPFRNLIDADGGRGNPAPHLKVEDIDGRKIRLLPGGQPEIHEPEVEVTELPDGSLGVTFKLAHIGQLEWAKAMVREMYPERQLKFPQTISQKKSQEYLHNPIHLPISLGGKEFFRGLLKSVFNLLGVNSPGIALNGAFDRLRSFVLTGEGEMREFVRFSSSAEPLWVEQFGEFDHFIGIWSRGNEVFGVASLYGGIHFLFRLTDQFSDEPFAFGYLVNPLRDTEAAENRNPEFDPSKFPSFDSGKEEPGLEIWVPFQNVVSQFMNKFAQRADSEQIGKIVEEALEPPEGKPIDQEMINQLVAKLRPYIEHRLRSPNFSQPEQ